MILRELNLLNFKNIHEANLRFADRLNCFIGLNGQGKTNLLDAIYMLSFTKSSFALQDNQCILHGEQMAMVKGIYEKDEETITISCALKQGSKKLFRRGDKPYQRLSDHIGLLPLVLISPQDIELVLGGSDIRRRFIDSTISQYDHTYLPSLNNYNQLLSQRNALLKQYAQTEQTDLSMLSIYEEQMQPLAEQIYEARKQFINHFLPFFEDTYHILSNGNEQVSLSYYSQLSERQLPDAWLSTRQRDTILGWTSVGIHKDDLLLTYIGSNEVSSNGLSASDTFPLKQVASQGQIKTCLLALRLAQALFLSQQTHHQPLLLLDDLFDRLDSNRVAQLLQFVLQDTLVLPSLSLTIHQPFSQIFLTDTDLNHLAGRLSENPQQDIRIFQVEQGRIV